MDRSLRVTQFIDKTSKNKLSLDSVECSMNDTMMHKIVSKIFLNGV